MMQGDAKTQRQAKAVRAAMDRTLRRLYSLSAILQRTIVSYEAYHQAASCLFEDDRSDDQLLEGIHERLARLEINEMVRASAHLAVYLASLYTLIEGWRKWNFADPEVDRLLEDAGKVQRLKEFRHTVFHAAEFDDPDVERWAQVPDNAEWTSGLTDAFRNALRSWHANLEARVTAHLLRTGV